MTSDSKPAPSADSHGGQTSDRLVADAMPSFTAGEILARLALRLDQPETWWRRVGEPGLVLGEDRYLAAVDGAMALKVYDSPLRWLQGGCDGTVLLDDVEARWTSERFAEDEAALQAWWGTAA